jgi:flagellar motor switch protein FliN
MDVGAWAALAAGVHLAMEPLDPKTPSDDGPVDAAAPPVRPSFGMLKDVEVDITLELGRKRMRIADVLRLRPGNTIDLPKSAGEPLDVYVNGKLIARGEPVVVGDRYGVRIVELASEPHGEEHS